MDKVVYFAREPLRGRVKIGCTVRLATRLLAISRDAGAKVELLATVEGGRSVEDAFHALLHDLHDTGEWFFPGPRLDAVICGVREGWFDLSKLPDCPSPIRQASARKAWATRDANGTRFTRKQAA